MTRQRRIGLVHAALALLAIAVLWKSAQVQLLQGSAWAAVARRQHFSAAERPAPRGVILDAGGRTLATTREVVRLEIAPREVRDLRRLRSALRVAGVDQTWTDRATDVRRAWVILPGRYVAEDVAAIAAMRGVYATPVSERTYAASSGLLALLGRVDQEGRGIDGVELVLDSLLRGTDGASRLVRDARGRAFTSPTNPGLAPEPGHVVVLTINHELQDIAERTLADAVARLGADGGDIVILDPRSGEVLAMAGERHGKVAKSVTGVTEPFEPGSTLKPLIASALLAQGKARVNDRVPTRGGSYQLHGRVIHDEPHPGPTPALLTLSDVIRLSSNVGIVQFAQRLTPQEEFEALRDFGLGTSTGIPYSAEASGVLRPPSSWSRQTPASMAMGYEVSVTPLQLALAYAAIANGGELLEPLLVKEIREPGGRVIFRASRRAVRRVMPEDVARTMRHLLADVVQDGTAVAADLATYAVAGKTGTPRRTMNGRYAPLQYNPNFVGLFPADAPQLVVVVKLSGPKGNFYGGATAAPVTKTILQAALAARDAALDRSALAGEERRSVETGRSSIPAPARVAQSGTSARAAGQHPTVAAVRRVSGPGVLDEAASGAHGVVLDVPSPPDLDRSTPPPRTVPDVKGMTLRQAVRSLHSAGFRVLLARGAFTGSVTDPAPGVMAPSGALIRLRYTR